MHLIPKLVVTVTKTAQGNGHYIQVMSEDGMSVNFVCIADLIEVLDLREEKFIQTRKALRSKADPTEVIRKKKHKGQ